MSHKYESFVSVSEVLLLSFLYLACLIVVLYVKVTYTPLIASSNAVLSLIKSAEKKF